MTTRVDLGRIERMELRTLWPHEAHDFTPWLADNIDLLNESLPFDIEPESIKQEAAAGRFSVDIVGNYSTDQGDPGKVIIENQLGQTDHDHLGKLLTYLAAFQAKAGVWIAGQARPEHAKAVQWLNDNGTVDAYLFQIEAIRIGDSVAAPLFTQIVGPSDLSYQVKASRQADSLRKERILEYWAVVLPAVQQTCQAFGAWQDRTPPTYAWIQAKVPGAPGTYWVMRNQKTKTSVDLYFGTSSKERNRAYLQEFSKRLPEDFGLVVGHKPEGILAKLTRDFPGGWSSDRRTQEQTAGQVATFMAKLVEATNIAVKDLPPYNSLEVGEET